MVSYVSNLSPHFERKPSPEPQCSQRSIIESIASVSKKSTPTVSIMCMSPFLTLRPGHSNKPKHLHKYVELIFVHIHYTYDLRQRYNIAVIAS